MSTIPPQTVQIRCQNCQNPFATPVWSLIDVGLEPQMKGALLSGQINVAVCPNCGMGGMLSTPVAYHDPARKLFLVHIPQELNLKPEEHERFVGEVTRVLMSTLPQDASKGHLLTPRHLMSMQSLIETVMEAEGISKESLREQQMRVMVLSELAEAFEHDQVSGTLDSEESKLAQVAQRHQEQLNYEFFLTLTAYADAAAQQGRAESATMLMELRDRLVQITGFDAVAAGLEAPDAETVIVELEQVEEAALEEAIGNHRPTLDETLWETWETRIATLEPEAAAHSQNRLDFVKTTVHRMDEEAQAIFEAATALVRQALAAEDPKTVLEQHRGEINEAFMLVIEANMAAAARSGQMDIVQQLDTLRRVAVQVIEDAMSPQERLINQLLNAESGAEATKLLRKHMSVVNQDFVKHVNGLIEQMEQSGRKEAVERLRQISRESASLLF